MNKNTELTVNFDPGFAQYYPSLDGDIINQIDTIINLKAFNQKKFRLQVLENNLVKPFKNIMGIFHGCVIYGSIIASKYTQPPAQVINNPMSSLTDSEKANLDLTFEVSYSLEIYENLNKTCKFIFKRETKLPEKLLYYAKIYKEFILLNNHFKELQTTEQIKLPPETEHFRSYDIKKLNDLEEKIILIAQKGPLEEVFNIS